MIAPRFRHRRLDPPAREPTAASPASSRPTAASPLRPPRLRELPRPDRRPPGERARVRGRPRGLAGRDPLDSTSPTAPCRATAGDRARSREGLKIGVPREYFPEGIEPRCASGCARHRGLPAARRRGARGLAPAHPLREPDLRPHLGRPRRARTWPATTASTTVTAPRSRGPPRPLRALARGGLRARGQATDHGRDLRPERGLLRRLLQQGVQGAEAPAERLRCGLSRGGCRRLPDITRHGLSHRREDRRSPEALRGRCPHRAREPRLRSRALRSRAASRARACRSASRSTAGRFEDATVLRLGARVPGRDRPPPAAAAGPRLANGEGRIESWPAKGESFPASTPRSAKLDPTEGTPVRGGHRARGARPTEDAEQDVLRLREPLRCRAEHPDLPGLPRPPGRRCR